MELFANSDVANTVVLLCSVARTALAPSVKFVVSEFPRDKLSPESIKPAHAPYSCSADFERMVLTDALVNVTLPDDDATSMLSAEPESLPETCPPSFVVTNSASSDVTDLIAS